MGFKNINLEIEKGEILGIVGKNGAGKSTLLKLLSKVTKPSRAYPSRENSKPTRSWYGVSLRIIGEGQHILMVSRNDQKGNNFKLMK